MVAEPIEAQPFVVDAPLMEVTESFVEIYTRQGKKRLVTALEVLSPTNKSSGDKGREAYLQKLRRQRVPAACNTFWIGLASASGSSFIRRML